MNNLLNISTPAQAQAKALAADFGLENLGFSNLRQVYWNLPSEALYEEIVFRNEGKMVRDGEILVIPVPAGAIAEVTPTAAPLIDVQTTPPEPKSWQLWWSLFFDSAPPQIMP